MKKIIHFIFSIISFIYSQEYLAVLNFESLDITKNESKALTESLINEIINLGQYIIVERNDIDKILQEQKFQNSGCTDNECAVEIGQLLNADYTIIGNIGKVGSTYTINARFIKVETGEVVRSAEYIHRGEVDKLLTSGIKSIAPQLLGIESENMEGNNDTQEQTNKAEDTPNYFKEIKNEFINNIFSFYSQNFGGNIGLIGQFPQGEFKDQGVTTGLGIEFNGMYYLANQFAIGLNLGGSIYDYSIREIPFSYYTDLVTITERTSHTIGFGHLFFRTILSQGNIKPYVEGLVGVKNLSTTTELVNNNCDDDEETEYDDCQIAESTNASDNALSYGVGGGIEIKLITIENKEEKTNGDLSFFINGRYLWGGEAEYLKEGDIQFTDPKDGPVQTSFHPSLSKTDLLQLTIGLSIKF